MYHSTGTFEKLKFLTKYQKPNINERQLKKFCKKIPRPTFNRENYESPFKQSIPPFVFSLTIHLHFLKSTNFIKEHKLK